MAGHVTSAYYFLHHKSHQVVSKFFWIDIEPLRKFFEICGVWPKFLLDWSGLTSKPWTFEAILNHSHKNFGGKGCRKVVESTDFWRGKVFVLAVAKSMSFWRPRKTASLKFVKLTIQTSQTDKFWPVFDDPTTRKVLCAWRLLWCRGGALILLSWVSVICQQTLLVKSLDLLILDP